MVLRGLMDMQAIEWTACLLQGRCVTLPPAGRLDNGSVAATSYGGCSAVEVRPTTVWFIRFDGGAIAVTLGTALSGPSGIDVSRRRQPAVMEL
jgi:hypothetical protein